MYVAGLTRWLRLPGLARSAEPVWVSIRGVRPDILHLERASPRLGYYLVHAWLAETDLFEPVEQMFLSIGGERPPHPVTAGDRTDPIIGAFLDERLWLWRVPIQGVLSPAVFPEKPRSTPPPRKPTESLTWIEILVADRNGPLVDEPVHLVDERGNTWERRTDRAGLVRVESLPAGHCDVSLPRVDGREWSLGSGPAPASPAAPPEVVERRVVPGDCLSSLADSTGFRTWQTIWKAPANAELRALRPNPNMLAPGDRVWVPVSWQKEVSCATTRRHSIFVEGAGCVLRLRLVDEDGKAIAHEPVTLEHGGRKSELFSNGDGEISTEIPRSLRRARLRYREETVDLDVGTLHPVLEEQAGALPRMSNLGYPTAFAAADDHPSTIAAFQRAEGLVENGQLDAETIRRLRERHRS